MKSAKTGKPKETTAPWSRSESPSWPFPPARLTDRLSDPAVLCPACGHKSSVSRCWCEYCGATS